MAKNPGLSLKQFQAVEATVRLGSFTEAARALGVSQPTVSNLVVAAEGQYGCKLLLREGNKITPSPMYQSLRGQVIALLSLSEEIDAVLGAHRDLERAELRLGYTTYQIAMPLIAGFARAYPGVELTARALASHDLLPLLASGDLDIGFITARECPAELAGQLITPSRVGVVVPRAHRFAGQGEIGWADLAEERLLQRELSSATRRIFEAAARIAGARIHTILGLGSWGSICSLVRSGMGIGVALEVEYMADDDLAFVPLDDKNLVANHYLVALKPMMSVAPVRAFFETANELAPEGRS